MMIKSIIICQVLATLVTSQSSTMAGNMDCCKWKVVGGKKYELVGKSDEASDYGCTSDCVYMTEGKNIKYCFKPGQFEAECYYDGEGSNSMSTGSSMTGESTEPSMTQGNTGGPTSAPGASSSAAGPTSAPGGSSSAPGGGSTGSNADYCSLNSDHTMCKYPGPSAACSSKTIFREMSSEAKQAILDKHNELRRRVAKGEETGGINAPQPGASNMRKLVWSAELESVAQRWADQCTFGHDTSREKLDGTSVGQNAYWGANSQEENEAAIQGKQTNAAQNWYDEVTDPGFDSQTINPYTFNSGTGHYTQVVWAKTEELGCGMVYYKGDNYFENLIVCNYAVAGNLIGSEMYKAGTACADCPTGYTCDDGLCAKA